MNNTFGHCFCVTTYGESHCKGVGAVVEGCPPRFPLTEADIQPALNRRRPGQNALSTPRQEGDGVTILSGTENGLTLGTPISLLVMNKNQRPGDYQEMSRVPRPSHADFTYQAKYGIRANSGGGRASARETIGRVAAGAIADKILKTKWNIDIIAYVSAVGSIVSPHPALDTLTRKKVDETRVRCPHQESAQKMEELIETVRDEQDSIGGVIDCVCSNVPAGWGDPVFGKLEASLAHAMLSIPASKGFEIGSGFAGTAMRGSQHNDAFVQKARGLGTASNHSGGIQGGISNGEPILIRVAFKPVATIGKAQQTADFDGNQTTLAAKGRHDPCVLPRAVPVVEAMAALVLMDAALKQAAVSL